MESEVSASDFVLIYRYNIKQLLSCTNGGIQLSAYHLCYSLNL
jgi:hypothetical protein